MIFMSRLKTARPRNAMDEWSMTDPKEHDPSNFRYLVHCIPSKRQMTQHRPVSNRHIAFLDQEGFVRQPRISCSLIDHTKVEPFGNIGIILDVPVGNIIAASPHDIAVHFFLDNFDFYFRAPGLPSPEEFMQLAGGIRLPSYNLLTGWNEVAIRGMQGRSVVKISGGVIFMPFKLDEPDDPMVGMLRSFCDERSLPFLELRRTI